MPGPEPEPAAEPAWAARMTVLGAVALAAAAVRRPSGPSLFSFLLAPGGTAPALAELPWIVGWLPEAPGRFSSYWSSPEFDCATAALGSARARRLMAMVAVRRMSIRYG